MPTALQLLDSPSPAVRRQSVLTLAEACRYVLMEGFETEDTPRLVAAALDVLPPYDTAVKRLAAARIFRCAQPSQHPLVLPLLIGFLEHEDEVGCLIESCDSIGDLVDSHHPPLSQYGDVASKAVSLLRHGAPGVSAAAFKLIRCIIRLSSEEQRCSSLDKTCRREAAYLLARLKTAVAASPLMDEAAAFLPLLIESIGSVQCACPTLTSLCGLCARLIDSATPAQRPLFLSAGVMPQLLSRIDFSHAAGSSAQKSNWNILLALHRIMAWEECSVQSRELHPFCLQLLQSGLLPQLEGQWIQKALPHYNQQLRRKLPVLC